MPEPTDTRDALLKLANDLLDTAQCACSVAERDSGHLVECWYPAWAHGAEERLDRLARLPSSSPLEGWQPIETAPEMRKIIVSYENALGKRRCVMACYYRAHSLEMHDDYDDVGEYDEATGESFAPAGWYEEHDSDNPMMPLSEQPDFWMPLPAAPSGVPVAAQEQT